MTTLAELYEEYDVKSGNYRVVVAGHDLGHIRFNYSYEMGRVPEGSFKIEHPLPSYVITGAIVEFYTGFAGLYKRVFTGKVESPTLEVDGVYVECSGFSRTLDLPYKRDVILIDNEDQNDVVALLLDDSGLVDYVVNLPGSWILATVEPIELEFQTLGEAINKIAEVYGSPFYELPTGQVRVELRDPLPAPTAFRIYHSGQIGAGWVETSPAGVTNPDARPRLRTLRRQTLLSEVKNRVVVRGAVVDTVNPDTFETNSDLIETTAEAVSPFIPNPPEFHEYVFSNELIDTPVVAAEVAIRYIGLKNRLEQRIAVAINGDPEMFLGATVEIIDLDYTTITGKWFVWGYQANVSDSGYEMTLDLRGGGPPAGTSPQLDPFADFIWRGAKIQQVVPVAAGGDDDVMVLITFDGSVSSDFDGSLVVFDWSDDDGHTGNGEKITFLYDPDLVNSINMELTVTDNDGRTDSVTKQVDITAAASVPPDPSVDDSNVGGGVIHISHFYVAADGYMMASQTYGQSFVDRSVAAAGATGLFISVSAVFDFETATGVACFGTTTGEIHRTTDGCATSTKVLTIPNAPRVEHIWADTLLQNIWWACTSNGQIWRSADDGATWGLYKDFGDGLPLYRLATPPSGQLFVYGGSNLASNTLVRFALNKASPVFNSVGFSGAVAAAIAATPAGFVQEAATSLAHELLLVFGGGMIPAIWWSPNIADPEAWVPTTGFVPAVGKAAAPNLVGGQYVVIGNSLTSYTTIIPPTFISAGPTPSQVNHLFHETPLLNCYVGAADGGVVKSIDFGVSWGYVRPNAFLGTTWPAGAVGRMITFIAGPQQQAAAELYVITDAPAFQRLTNVNSWSVKDGTPYATGFESSENHRLRSFYGAKMFYQWIDSLFSANRVAQRSLTQGESWAGLANPVLNDDEACQDVDYAPDGRLWAAFHDEATINTDMWSIYSDDDGDTWVNNAFLLGGSCAGYVACHPTNPNMIAVSGVESVTQNPSLKITTNRGVGWGGEIFFGFGPWVGVPARSKMVWTTEDMLLAISADAIYRITIAGAVAVVYAGSGDPIDIIRCGNFGPYFALFNQANGIIRSSNHGATWEEFARPVAATPNGLAYDLLTDTLYAAYNGLNVGVYKLKNASSVTPAAAVWEALSGFANGDTLSGNQQIVLAKP